MVMGGYCLREIFRHGLSVKMAAWPGNDETGISGYLHEQTVPQIGKHLFLTASVSQFGKRFPAKPFSVLVNT